MTSTAEQARSIIAGAESGRPTSPPRPPRPPRRSRPTAPPPPSSAARSSTPSPTRSSPTRTRSSRRPSPRATCRRPASRRGRSHHRPAADVRRRRVAATISASGSTRRSLTGRRCRAPTSGSADPLGPVAVFGASNFLLAFSTAGGDTRPRWPPAARSSSRATRPTRAPASWSPARSAAPSPPTTCTPARSRSCSPPTRSAVSSSVRSW